MNEVEIYKMLDGETELEVRFEGETVWLNQDQRAELFQTDRTSILKHLKNIIQAKSSMKDQIVQKLHKFVKKVKSYGKS